LNPVPLLPKREKGLGDEGKLAKLGCSPALPRKVGKQSLYLYTYRPLGLYQEKKIQNVIFLSPRPLTSIPQEALIAPLA
jgi:hypothetical protein